MAAGTYGKPTRLTSISMLLAGNLSCSTWNASFCLKTVIDHVQASTLKWGCGGWHVCRAHSLKMAACLNLFWTRTTGRNFPCNTKPQQTCPNTHCTSCSLQPLIGSFREKRSITLHAQGYRKGVPQISLWDIPARMAPSMPSSYCW